MSTFRRTNYIDAVGLYPIITREESLFLPRGFLYPRTEKKKTTETLLEFLESVSKNNVFSLMGKL